MRGKRRVSWAERRRQVQALRDSGLTLDEFCLREGIGRSTLRRWRKTVEDEGRLAAGGDVRGATPPSFAEVRVLPEGSGLEAQSPSASPSRVSIHLSSGDRLWISEACDPRWLGQVVRALRSGSC